MLNKGIDMEKKDYFGVNSEILKKKKLFLFDMDGTIYEENRLFEGTLELLDKIKTNGGRYVFITNNSSKSVKDYVSKVKEMGIDVTIDDFFTSAQATILYLKQWHPNAVVYCQGTQSFVNELMEAGIKVDCEVNDNAEVVVVGFDTELTSEKLRKTCEMLRRDVAYIATNPDLRCPVSFGYIPDCGSICRMIESTIGKKPIFIGKPEATMVDFVRDKFCVAKEETVVVGDRLYTDIAVGLNAGVTAICVLTGEATAEDIKKNDIKPTFTFKSVKEIVKVL